ncbi:DNA polymerase [Clostridium sp. FP1]|uniref:DNA polymerase n=1 Tax=Clostridium sp. FP1 TaxID=2724076 RepID=UPI0013E934AA|nr:DNA polymerase [Clostridium sp. FP1]MBZ9633047.1 DNA polymerase [Clostridium sp. FP1]
MADVLCIDVETYSSVDIATSGAYKYCEAPDFEIMLFAYAFNDEEVKIIDFNEGEILPQRVIDALYNPNIIKSAFNANFERNAIKNFLGTPTPPEMWQCTMVKALTMGLPGSLGMVGTAMHLPEDKQKMKEGKALIQYFCKPCKSTKTNGGRTRNLPEHDMEKWEIFKSYCMQDVVAERDIKNKLSIYLSTDKEQRLWELDQHINDRGVGTDLVLIEKAIECDATYSERLKNEAREITGLANPNSAAQLKKWIGDKLGHEVSSLTKESVAELLEVIIDADVVRILELRQLMAKTSIKKYQTMQNSRCEIDGRVRGLLQFYGANRTGRWAGRLVQVQNLPQNHLPDLDDARNLVRTGQFDEIEFLYDSIPDTLSQLIRTAFIPREGNRFMIADFSAIEARVIAWLAGEKWRLDVFNTHGKIYEASASQMFHVPIESVKKGSELRQKGKIAELALGYGGSVGALSSMDKNKSIPEDELTGLVKSWRNANVNITKFWWDCDKGAKKAITERTTVCMQFGLKFICAPGVLFIQLPSGRKLSYVRPKIEDGKFGKPVVTYEGMEQTTKQWTTLETYGPKIVENIVQATARDCLAEAMFKVQKAGYDIVMHVHDEIIMDVPKGFGSMDAVNNIFGEPIAWAPGLPLKADGYECNYYMKD